MAIASRCIHQGLGAAYLPGQADITQWTWGVERIAIFYFECCSEHFFWRSSTPRTIFERSRGRLGSAL